MGIVVASRAVLACVFFCGVAKSENRRALKRDARRRTTTDDDDDDDDG